MKKLIPTALLSASFAAQSITASAFFYEGFDYGGTNISNLAGTGGWTDFNAGAKGIISYDTGGLSYNDLAVSGGTSLAADTSNQEVYYSQNVSRPSDALNTGSFVYFSFLNQSGGDGSRSFGLTTANDDTNFGLRVYRVNDGGTGRWQLQVGGTSDLVETSVTNNFDGMILGRITMQAGADLVEMWINPNISSEASLGTADASVVANTPGFNFVRLESGNFPSNLKFDEIRLGTSFADVAPVPEPSSYALISGALALGLIMVRRRR